MPRYRCCFLDENDQVVRTEELQSCDDSDAHREAMTLFAKIGRFSGYELWQDGRKVDERRPVEPASN
jgi:hypothetical protein